MIIMDLKWKIIPQASWKPLMLLTQVSQFPSFSLQYQQFLLLTFVIDASALQVSHKEDSLGAVSYEELKARFLAELNVEAEPLDSLGFISVVQSDIDDKLEEEIPDAAD